MFHLRYLPVEFFSIIVSEDIIRWSFMGDDYCIISCCSVDSFSLQQILIYALIFVSHSTFSCRLDASLMQGFA